MMSLRNYFQNTAWDLILQQTPRTPPTQSWWCHVVSPYLQLSLTAEYYDCPEAAIFWCMSSQYTPLNSHLVVSPSWEAGWSVFLFLNIQLRRQPAEVATVCQKTTICRYVLAFCPALIKNRGSCQCWAWPETSQTLNLELYVRISLQPGKDYMYSS